MPQSSLSRSPTWVRPLILCGCNTWLCEVGRNRLLCSQTGHRFQSDVSCQLQSLLAIAWPKIEQHGCLQRDGCRHRGHEEALWLERGCLRLQSSCRSRTLRTVQGLVRRGNQKWKGGTNVKKENHGFITTDTLAQVYEANAMCLATASADGFPSARMVLLKK